MKLLLSLMIAGSALFAGGDIVPVQTVTKFEKPVVSTKCYKPNIQKCPDCDDVAMLCPDNPQLPMAKTEPCEVTLTK